MSKHPRIARFLLGLFCGLVLGVWAAKGGATTTDILALAAGIAALAVLFLWLERRQ